MCSAVEGRGFTQDGVEMVELYGGARINYIFTEIFGKSLMTIDPFATLTDEEIRTAICNANGTRPALFVPEISFDLLVKRQISRLEQPGLQCVDLVFDELLRSVAPPFAPPLLVHPPVGASSPHPCRLSLCPQDGEPVRDDGDHALPRPA